MFESLLFGLSSIMHFNVIIMILGGVSIGIILGAIPGLTATMAIALVIPMTFYMSPVAAIAMLVGAYKGGLYGGSISAILLGTPGTAAAVATVLDGHEMAKKNKAGKALTIALYSSVMGDLFSLLILVLIAPSIAKYTLKIGPAELFSIIIFALAIVGALAGESLSKGLIASSFGLLVASVGLDPILGTRRLCFGIIELDGGIPIIPALIGLFAMPVLINQLEKIVNSNKPTLEISKNPKDSKLSWKEFVICLKVIFMGCGIGTFIGAVPGIGGSVASWLSYKVAKDTSKNPKKFGSGCLEGIAAPEAANNAVCGGALIPMLTLGVPGSVAIAILMSAFVIQGITPGPMIFKENSDVVYGIFASLFVSNFLLLFIGTIIIKYAAPFFCNIPKTTLFPFIMCFCFAGSFAASSLFFGIKIMLMFSVIGYIMQKFNFPVAPFLISMILQPFAERSLRQFLIINNGRMLAILSKPIAMFFILLTVISLCIIILQRRASNEQ